MQQYENESGISTIHFLNEPKLFNEILNNSGEILVVDFRRKDLFDKASFSNYSISLPFDQEDISDEYCSLYNPKSWEDHAESEDIKKVIKKMRRFFIVLVFSNESSSKDEIKNLLNKLKDNTELIDKEKACFKALLFYNMLINNKIRELGCFSCRSIKILSSIIIYLNIKSLTIIKLMLNYNISLIVY